MEEHRWRNHRHDVRRTLTNGQTFSGGYLEITQQAVNQDADSLWEGSDRGWNDWYASRPFPEFGFATVYSGRVMANLQAADGHACAAASS